MDKKVYERAVFLIRAKVDQYSMSSDNQENRVRYNVIKHVKPKGYQQENEALLERLGRYSKMI